VVKRLLEQNAVGQLYDCTAHDLERQFGLSEKAAQAIAAGLKDFEPLETELGLMHKHGIRLVTLADSAYPALLKEIDTPPPVLYYRGQALDAFQKNIAVIGSRKAGSYAREVAASFLPALIEHDWSIVSGGALGADTMAHEQSLAAKGHTIAVLGSGLLCPYPYSNRTLFERIQDSGGAVVSSFPLRMQPFPGNFPARNRIISGLSQACLVLQAAERSGASITANFALNQGRLVLAVPGSIFDPLSAGCHALIKEGATPVGSVQDLLIELGERPALQASAELQEAIPFASTSADKEDKSAGEASPEGKILRHCRVACSFDDLIMLVELEEELLQEHLFNLQLAGKLQQNAVGLWQTV
jgi:DNA processing protein